MRKPTGRAAIDGQVRAADSAIIRRYEHKFEMDPALAVELEREVARRLPLYEFRPGYPTTCVSTIYFDTEDRRLFSEAERSYDDNVKLRVKEYSYSRPEASGRGGDLAEEATIPYCFVELKRRSGGQVTKTRFPLPKHRLGTFLAGGDVRDDVETIEPACPAIRAAYVEIADFLRHFSIRPIAMICYSRTVYQEREAELRITFDDAISIYPPPPGLYDAREALTPLRLGKPSMVLGYVIAEIKCPGVALPTWLDELLRRRPQTRTSKFTTSVRSLDGVDSGRTSSSPPRASDIHGGRRSRNGRSPFASRDLPTDSDSRDAPPGPQLSS